MSGARQAAYWAAGAAVFLVLLYLLRGVLMPFVAGLAVAYFLDPVADRLEARGLSRLWATIAIVAGVFGIGQLAEGNFLTPKLVGDKVGLHPVWVIFALMAGGALFGFTGVMLAVPVAAVIGVLTRFGLTRYLASSLFRGANPG